MAKVVKQISNDNTLKGIGFEYQKLLALECCLEAAPNTTIYIECLGDICDGSTSTEVKHHITQGYLTPQSIDFWKTLKNLVVSYELLSCCSRFILKTTHMMFREEGWKTWNTATCEKKLSLISQIKPCDTIKVHHAKIFSSEKSILLDILSKFEIVYNADNIQVLLDKLQFHNTLKTFPIENRSYVLKELIGYITKCAIDTLGAGWQVDINSFDNELQRLARIYNSEKILFPREKKAKLMGHDFEDYTFIKQLREIEYHIKVESAAQDFFRSNKSRIQLLKKFPNLAETLDFYDEDVSDELVNIKGAKLDEANDLKLPLSTRHSLAKKVFNECMSISLREINGVEGTEIYYQRGRMHSFVENGKFHWVIREDEFYWTVKESEI